MFPLTAHLRVPGTLFEDVMREALRVGESVHVDETDHEGWVAGRVAALREPGMNEFTLGDGRHIEHRKLRTGEGGTLIVLTDVTERRTLERQVESSRAKLDDALATMSDGMALYDADLRLVFCNARYQGLFPRTAHLRVPGAYFPDLIRAGAKLGEGRVFQGDAEELVAERVASLRQSGVSEFSLRDGRWVQQRAQRTSDGGVLLLLTEVTERRRLELEVESSRQKLDEALSTMTDALVMYDADLRLVLCNERYREMFAKTAHLRVPGAHIMDVLRESARLGEGVTAAEDDLEAGLAAAVARLRRGGVNELVTGDGRVIEGHSQPTRDGGFVMLLHDITSRRQLETDLARSRNELDEALSTMPDGLAMYDADLRLVLCNPQYRRMFPLTAHLRVPRTPFVDILREAMRVGEGVEPEGGNEEKLIAESVARLRHDGMSEFALGDGRCIECRTKLTPDGGCLLVLTDVTERRQLARQLESSKGKLDEALATMSDALAMYDADLRLVLCNEQYRKLLPHSADVLVPGVAFQDIVRAAALQGDGVVFAGDDLDALVAERVAFLENAGVGEVVFRDGRCIESRKQRTREGGFLLLMRDITERKRLELQLQKSRDELDDALTSMADGLAMYDADLRLVLCNARYQELFPLSGKLRVPGSSFRESIREAARLGEFASFPRDPSDAFIDERIAYIRRGGVRVLELFDGRYIELRMQATAEGGFVLLVADITDRKRLELQVERSRNDLDEALTSMADGLAMYDADQRLVLCNERYREMFPRTAHLRVPGTRFHDILRAAADLGEGLPLPEVDGDRAVEERAACMRRPGTDEFVLQDGRYVETRRQRTRDGGTLLVISDITERKRIAREIEHQATHDALTGLANRALLHHELDIRLERAAQSGDRLGVLLLDLDEFKDVNDIHGHVVGDALLRQTAQRLRDTVRESDLVARFGGDEFAVLAWGHKGPGAFRTLAQRVVEAMAQPFTVNGIVLEPCCSVGISIYPRHHGTPEQLLTNADRALFAAKQAGGATWRVFEPDMLADSKRVEAIGAAVMAAVARGEMDVDYQPIVDLGTLDVVAVEALVRWNHPERGRLDAHEFIHAAESGPAILPLTDFMLRRTARDLRTWREAGVCDVQVWVNLAPRCLVWDGLLKALSEATDGLDIPPDRLVLEVTEGVLMGAKSAERRLAALRELGLKIAIDDFGIGYSSLGRLASLPVDVLKIDRSFVTDMTESPRGAAVVGTIVALGSRLGLVSEAEGVETLEQLHELRRLGCRLAQGFLIAQPMPADDFLVWLDTWRRRRWLGPGTDLLLLPKTAEPSPTAATGPAAG